MTSNQILNRLLKAGLREGTKSKVPVATVSQLEPTERQLSLARDLGLTVTGLSRKELSDLLELRLEHLRNESFDDPRDYEDDEAFEREDDRWRKDFEREWGD